MPDGAQDSTASRKQKLEVHDTVVLRQDGSLIGTVLRTYQDFNTHDPIEDELIIGHALPVPLRQIDEFLAYGKPPQGYIFVEWAKEECGYSLLNEDDVILVNRNFTIGDVVKRRADEALLGTIINVYETYTLEPILSGRAGHPLFTSSTPGRGVSAVTHPLLPEGVRHATPDRLLYGIPGEELRRAEDFEDGDYVIQRDWLGIVGDQHNDVVLLLENGSLVVVESAEELELIVPDFGDKPVITMPETDDYRRPDVLVAHYNGVMSTPCLDLHRGQFCITNHQNLRNGRWLKGSFTKDCAPQGHIVDIRTRWMDVQWLCPNAFANEVDGKTPPAGLGHVHPYDNLRSFRNIEDLRRNKALTLYESTKQPSTSTHLPGGRPIMRGRDDSAGDHLKFRDQAGAALKYSKNNEHSTFHRVLKSETYGCDLNEFVIVCSKQEATIQWQSGVITQEQSVDLRLFTLPEAELCPGDIVVLKQGMEQIPVGRSSNATPAEFNEMLYFQGNFGLRPKKVGVIQSVDSKERLARIRMFVDPRIELLEQGNVLKAGSQLGPISDEVQEVSLYEVMPHPVLQRKRRDLVIIPPARASAQTLERLEQAPPAIPFGPSMLSYLRGTRYSSKFQLVSNIARYLLLASDGLVRLTEDTGPTQPLDWIGEIVDIGLDGVLTVRLGGNAECRDIRMPFENVLMVCDIDAELDEGSTQWSTDDPWDEYVSSSEHLSDYESAIDEEVEYEGGERLDDDDDEDQWMTDDDKDTPDTEDHDELMRDAPQLSSTPEQLVEKLIESAIQEPAEADQLDNARSEDHPMERANMSTASSQKAPQQIQPSHTTLSKYMDQTDPPATFAVLDSDPPPDQFGLSETTPSSSAFMKRIIKEHKILSSSLPPNEVYVRAYESRLDLLRCLIIGPIDTPYEFAPFVVDLHFPSSFPKDPPVAHFHSWTGGLGRINPNLYEEGKVCLSLLGTWPGQAEQERWTEKSSVLQILISLMGLVLVKDPFYNEAGFESYGEEGLYKFESLQYNEKAFVMARGFVKHALLSPVRGLEDVLAYLYLRQKPADGMEISAYPMLLGQTIQRSKRLIDCSKSLDKETTLVNGAGSPGDVRKAFLRPLSKGAEVMLKKTVTALEELEWSPPVVKEIPDEQQRHPG